MMNIGKQYTGYSPFHNINDDEGMCRQSKNTPALHKVDRLK